MHADRIDAGLAPCGRTRRSRRHPMRCRRPGAPRSRRTPCDRLRSETRAGRTRTWRGSVRHAPGSVMNTAGAGNGVCRNRPDAVAQSRLAQRLGQAEQVIVVRPDQVVRPHQPRQRPGEQVVHPAIAVELRPVELRVADLVVQRRPQRAIGEAAIELIVVAARQVEREQRDRADGAFQVRRRSLASVISPLQPNQMPPFCFSASSTPAASPPAVGSPSVIGATRLETTTRRGTSDSRSFRWARTSRHIRRASRSVRPRHPARTPGP